jgi:uncharacterized OsmC-like protein
MGEDPRFTISMERVEGFEFRVKFDWDGIDELVMDEPEPVGAQHGPNAVRVVAAAVGNCLTASLLFCLQRSRVAPDGPLETTVTGTLARNQQGRLRIGGVDVRIALPAGPEESEKFQRCFSLFEDYCVVTATLRQGLPVRVEVVDRDGGRLYQSAGEQS